MRKKVPVVEKGAEHALAWKRRAPRPTVLVAPGNGGGPK